MKSPNKTGLLVRFMGRSRPGCLLHSARLLPFCVVRAAIEHVGLACLDNKESIHKATLERAEQKEKMTAGQSEPLATDCDL